MKKKNSKTLIISLCSLILLGGASYLFLSKNKNSQIREDPSSYNDKADEDFMLNYKDIKLKNVGDEIVLEAKTNADATFSSVSFTSSDPSAISITRKNATSVILKKLRDFEGLVTIQAKSDDPFIDLTKTCTVRCYNNFKSFDDLYSGFIINNQNKYLDNCDVIYLKEGTKTCVTLASSTLFSEKQELKTGTYTKIEDQDLENIKAQFTNFFKSSNPLLDFTQVDNSPSSEDDESSQNEISFTIDYKTDIFNGKTSIPLTLTLDGITKNLTVTKYVQASMTMTDQTLVL